MSAINLYSGMVIAAAAICAAEKTIKSLAIIILTKAEEYFRALDEYVDEIKLVKIM